MRVIGLTGQTGAGKTTVCEAFARAGLDIINCDELARLVVRAGTPCLKELAAHFGGRVILPDGELDRRLLGGIVFGSAAELDFLNKTIFPYIKAELYARMKLMETGNSKLVVLDAPTLFESGADSLCDEIISVTAPEEKRRARIMERDGLTAAEAQARIASQNSDSFYAARSRHVIRNDGTPAELTAKAARLADDLSAASC